MRALLSNFQHDYYSQCGEDGIIQEILLRIGSKIQLDKWCVEFGAWDGVYLSNTCNLIRNNGYSAVLIEGNKARAKQLGLNFPQNNVHCICKFINFEGNDSLERVLSATPIPKDFDFLSIDIDGVDYYIFEGLTDYQPKIICIEFNPTIPNAVDFVQPKDFLIKQGSSARAINRLAIDKGYRLVAATASNLILLRDEFVSALGYEIPNLEDLNIQGNDPQYIFTGQDGTVLSNKDGLANWHGFDFPINKIQFLPKFLRVFVGDYGLIRKMFYAMFLLLRDRNLFLKEWKKFKFEHKL
jgi:hypothetical protein